MSSSLIIAEGLEGAGGLTAKGRKAAIGAGGTKVGKKAGQQSAGPKGMEKKFAMGMSPMISSFCSSCIFSLIIMAVMMYAMHTYM
jgi:hypothetical protein